MSSVSIAITMHDIEANIAGEIYFDGSTAVEGIEDAAPSEWSSACVNLYGPDRHQILENVKRLTFCVLVLKNGFTVTGKAFCADINNFDSEIGRKTARANAIEKVWPLMNYALKSALA